MDRVKCLLVDDREENLDALSQLLMRDDVELLRAQSGGDALDLLLAHEVALAFIDVHMPEMDGFELAELMRGSARTRHVPIIFVTAADRDQLRDFKGYDAGAVDVLYKPIDPRILKSKADIFFQLHRQKRQLVRDLEERTQALRLSEMFAAVLGHDLRTPLGAMITAAHVVRMQSTDEVVRESAARILSSGTRMSRMIADLLDLTRARLGGGIPINRAIADLGAIVRRVVQEHHALFPGRCIEVAHNGDLEGQWDGDRLAQVAANLIGNALRHGRPDTAVGVRLDGTSADVVVMTIANRGTIDMDALDELFSPFRSAPRQPGGANGLGLGLYISREIAAVHGGGIEVAASGGDEVEFSVRIPRSPTPNQSPEP